MAVGIVTKVIGDGNGGTVSLRYWCPDTSASPQLLFPAPLLVDSSGNLIDLSGATPQAVYGGVRFKTLTPSIEASALDAGDVIFDSEILTAVTRADDVPGWLMSLQIIDKSDSKAEIYVVLLTANSTLGTEDAAPSISDANSLNVLGVVHFASGAYTESAPTGWIDLGGASVARVSNINMPIQPVSGSDDIYVAAFTPGTPTFGATDAIKLIFGFAD